MCTTMKSRPKSRSYPYGFLGLGRTGGDALKSRKPHRARGRGWVQGRTQGASEHGLRDITPMGTRPRQGQLAWNVAHSAAAACHIATQSSALPLSACHVTSRELPRIEASPVSGEVPRSKIQTSLLCGEVFYCAAYGLSCVFGPSWRG
jgi:hypothetical protein